MGTRGIERNWSDSLTGITWRGLGSALLGVISILSAKAGELIRQEIPIYALSKPSNKDGEHPIFSNLPLGIAEIRSATQPARRDARILILIHGINESGQGWESLIERLTADSRNRVFFFRWHKWQPPKIIEQNLRNSILQIMKLPTTDPCKIKILAHSAGGVLLVDSLFNFPNFSPADERRLRDIELHTIASPLSGYGYAGAFLTTPFAGPVFAWLGSSILYQVPKNPPRLIVWFTRPQHDATVKLEKKFDSRFPLSRHSTVPYSVQELVESSHDGAILDVLRQLNLL